MRAIPTQSQFSLREGMWFVFSTGGHTLALWISLLSGKEELYVDGELRSSSQAISLSSTHDIEVGSSTYTIAFATRHLRECRFECTLSRDGIFVQGFSTQYIYTYKKLARVRMTTAALAVIATFAVLQAGLSPWYHFALFVGLVATFSLPTGGKGFVFHEPPLPQRSDA